MEDVNETERTTMNYRVECHRVDLDAPVNYFFDSIQNALDFIGINVTMSFVDGTDELPVFMLYVNGIEVEYRLDVKAHLVQ